MNVNRPLLAALFLALPGHAQSPPPASFPSAVELITVDAVVLDGEGRPVPGLTRDDFVVTEDGQPQEIVSFEPFTLEAGPAAPAPPSVVATNDAPAPRASRVFAILLDDLGLTLRDAEDTRRAVSSFLRQSLRDGDQVVLGTSSGEPWWSARLPEGREDALAVVARLKGRLTEPQLSFDQMSEYEAYAINSFATGGQVLQRVIQRWIGANLCDPRGPMCATMVRSRAVDLDGVRRQRTRATLAAVRRGVEAVASIRGRKSLLFFSRGFVEDAEAGVRALAAAAQEANVAVYFINARGLQALPGAMSAAESGPPPNPQDVGSMIFEDTVLDSAGAQSLADETGGLSVRNTNDLAGGAHRIAEESRIFYLLGFHPPPGKPAGEWRKLKVEVKGQGLKVRARRGYALRREAVPPGRSLAQVLDSPHDDAGVRMRAMVYVLDPRPKDLTRVLIAAEFEAGGLPLPKKGKSRSGVVELSLVVIPRDGTRAYRRDERVQVTVAEDEGEAWRAVAREFELPAGVARARVIVRDPVSGARGSVSQRFDVPSARGFRLSTPIVTNRLAPDGGKRPRPALAVHRVFAPAGNLYCEFEVFGASRVTAGFSVWSRDGRLVRRSPPTPIAPDADGRLVRLVGMALDGMEEAAYDLVLEVRDEKSGAALEHRESFTLGS
jgi:VWFA-related protein